MKADYSISDVNEAHNLVNYLLSEYSNDPYTLKETLREIRSLVHQANLKADKLITADWFKDFDSKDTIDTLTKEFPTLKWEENACEWSYTAEGTLGRLVVKVDYKINFIRAESVFKSITSYWELDIYLNDNDSFLSLLYTPTITKFNTLFELVTVAKQTLRPLCNLFSKLEIT
jgi:hypothetical protein